MKKTQFISFLAFFLVVFIMIFFVKVCMQEIIKYEFEKNATDKVLPFSVEQKVIEKPMSFVLFPWSKYMQKNISELSEEQKTFVQEKKLAECIVDMVNYDDILIQDRDSAVAGLYEDIRKLTTEDGREYYVWNRWQVEGIYIFAMVNMKGEIFSFHFVTDLECDGQGAIEYVEENCVNELGVYSGEYQFNNFEENREKFINKIGIQSMQIGMLHKTVNLRSMPNKIMEENGNLLLQYATITEEYQYIYLYLDNKTEKFSGYHLELY